MAKVNNFWLRSRDPSLRGPEERYHIRMVEDRSRFKAGVEYWEPYSVAHGLVHAGVAEFVDDDDNPVATAPRDRTLSELQQEAGLYNIATYDGLHKRPRTEDELRTDIAAAEAMVETLMQLKVDNLKRLLKDEELPVSGTKTELVARLVTHRVRKERDV